MNKDIAKFDADIPVSVLEDYEKREEIRSRLSRGEKVSAICNELGLQPSDVINSVKGYEAALRETVEKDKDFLRRKTEHIFRSLDDYDILYTEANKVYNDADSSKDRISALALMKNIRESKDKVQQIITSQVEVVHRVEQAQEAQERIITIVREVTGECTRCRNKIRQRLLPQLQLEGSIIDVKE